MGVWCVYVVWMCVGVCCVLCVLCVLCAVCGCVVWVGMFCVLWVRGVGMWCGCVWVWFVWCVCGGVYVCAVYCAHCVWCGCVGMCAVCGCVVCVVHKGGWTPILMSPYWCCQSPARRRGPGLGCTRACLGEAVLVSNLAGQQGTRTNRKTEPTSAWSQAPRGAVRRPLPGAGLGQPGLREAGPVAREGWRGGEMMGWRGGGPGG